jgi:hypothetical protein
MSTDIFISYSRRDQEFVTRLAADLDAQVAGVWFDQSAIQAGENWHDEIIEGISECKAFVLILSPDAMESRYVREEVNTALELGKTIFPILYRPAKWTGEFESLVEEIQTLDLRSGSYTDNFQKLVDGLIEAGAVRQASHERPFLRQPTRPSLNVVLSKIPGWAFAWTLGWLLFWIVVPILLSILVASQSALGSDDLLNFLVILTCAGIGGFGGGLVAGLFTMLALRPNAPSISWKHMSPTIRIWLMSGPLGLIFSGLITALMIAISVISVLGPEINCIGRSFGECIGSAYDKALVQPSNTILLVLALFLLFVTVAWFLTGMFAGWLAVRHIRSLEPGITSRQAWSVSSSWGCGAIIAALITIVTILLFSSIFEL